MIPQNRKQWLEGLKARSPGNVSYPIPIEKGGTGATTPEEARANLGVSGGGTVSSVNTILPTNGNVNVTVEISQAAYNAILTPDPKVTYYIYGGTGGTTAEEAGVNLGVLGGGSVSSVNGILPTNGNVDVTIEISQAEYNAISEPNPNVTYHIY